MATGALDANGIWQYGEDDNPNGTASGLLNLLAAAVSTAVGLIKGRLTALEAGNNVAYTPALTGIDVTKGTLDAHYARNGKMITVEGSFVLTNATAMSAAFKIAVPVAMASKYGNASNKIIGEAMVHDVSPSTLYPGFVTSDASTTVVALKVQTIVGGIATATSMGNSLITYAVGDCVSWCFTYEAA